MMYKVLGFGELGIGKKVRYTSRYTRIAIFLQEEQSIQRENLRIRPIIINKNALPLPTEVELVN